MARTIISHIDEIDEAIAAAQPAQMKRIFKSLVQKIIVYPKDRKAICHFFKLSLPLELQQISVLFNMPETGIEPVRPLLNEGF